MKTQRNEVKPLWLVFLVVDDKATGWTFPAICKLKEEDMNIWAFGIEMVGMFDGDPLTYMGVPDEIRSRLQFSPVVQLGPGDESCRKYLRDLTKAAEDDIRLYSCTVSGEESDMKVVYECWDRYWEAAKAEMQYTPDEIDKQWGLM